MKRLLFTAILFSSYATSTATAALYNQGTQTDSVSSAPFYDFGNIIKGVPVAKIFKIFNPGNKPIRIRTIDAPLYCEVAAWTQKPIKPGKAGLIKIVYNTDKSGVFNATLKIVYYDSENLKGENLVEDILVKGLAY